MLPVAVKFFRRDALTGHVPRPTADHIARHTGRDIGSIGSNVRFALTEAKHLASRCSPVSVKGTPELETEVETEMGALG